MAEMIKFFKKNVPETFDQIRISIASPEQIRSWSFGEIKKPETINYRTFKPERNGLFCARIFGPVKDYECLCGKYKRMKYRGVICEKCGVEVTLSKVRRERMGHIELASPVAHIWFLKSMPSRIGLMMDMTLKDLEAVLYFEKYVVTEPSLTPLKQNQFLTEEEYHEALNEHGDGSFVAMIGAEAVKHLLASLDLEAEKKEITKEFEKTKSAAKKKKLVKRLKMFSAFINSGGKPDWMILETIPVIPPELRPLVPLDGGRFATSDLNDLYRRVINRNNRLRRLVELRAPDIIVRNEKRMLQESVDALFDNGRRGRVITGSNKRPLKSLSEMLKGKQGRFRQNLLGKRVDYSGRSVIVVGPELKLHQCGLPKKMALELFKPFIFSQLERRGFSTTIKAAKKMVEKEHPEVWDILESVIREHPVLLNRAPTLHRLGIQAFEPVLIEGKAIQLHPLVCAAFNADFDGDQMAVHVPLSLESQLEARVLMMSTNNILSPANGRPIIVPSQDIVLGLYYLSLSSSGEVGEGMVFSDLSEIRHALNQKAVTLHTKIKARISCFDEKDNEVFKIIETTPGRVILGEILPSHPRIGFDKINRVLSKSDISDIIDAVYRYCGQKITVLFADRLMELGFTYSCKAGISFGKDDLVIPDSKNELVEKTNAQVKAFEQQYLDGLITQGEKYNKVVDAWSHCSDGVAQEMMKVMQPSNDVDLKKSMNSVFMMSDSGARGSAAQIKQLAGMRGLMAKPSGEIIETPIISNFKEGLSVLEYFNSTHGARKGLADTALKTANSGYLTRRLVDVAQDCIVTEEDCKTTDGLLVASLADGGNLIEPLIERIIGRTAAKNIVNTENNGKIIVKSGDLIEEDHVEAILQAGIEEATVRSVLTCKSKRGICSTCYGRDLARGTRVNIGEAVGIIAAQSIGEPGTQLTMRTFHIGGTAQRETVRSSIIATINGKIKIKNKNLITDSNGVHIVMNRNSVVIIEVNGKEKLHEKIPYGAKLLVEQGSTAKKGQKLAEWDPYTLPVISSAGGTVDLVDLEEGVSLKEQFDEDTGMSNKVVIDWKHTTRGSDLKPRITLRDKNKKVVKLKNGLDARHFLSVDAILNVNSGDVIKAGDVLARIPTESTKTRDITGGLPRVAELFEARTPKDSSVISEVAGKVKFGRDYKLKRRVIIEPEKGEPKEYLLLKGKHLSVQEGDYVEVGDALIDGSPVPQDILRILGVQTLANYLIKEVQAVYRLQGVKINGKHIEVIVRQMMQKVEITSSGDSILLAGEQIDKTELEDINQQLISKKKKPAKAVPILLGITKAALQTSSFVSAASFQETTRVLTEASVSGKVDNLVGLKENVIVGRLLPAGTGATIRRLQKTANDRDAKIVEKQKKNIQGEQESEAKKAPSLTSDSAK